MQWIVNVVGAIHLGERLCCSLRIDDMNGSSIKTEPPIENKKKMCECLWCLLWREADIQHVWFAYTKYDTMKQMKLFVATQCMRVCVYHQMHLNIAKLMCIEIHSAYMSAMLISLLYYNEALMKRNNETHYFSQATLHDSQASFSRLRKGQNYSISIQYDTMRDALRFQCSHINLWQNDW